MAFKLSRYGYQLAAGGGIGGLMDDLGRALSAGPDLIMLGGGNPASIPEVERRIREELVALLAEPDRFESTFRVYGPPQGHGRFIDALCALFNREFGWPIG